MNSQKSLLVGTVVGGALGAAAALLTAPKSGEALREDLSKQVEAGKFKTEEMVQMLKEKMDELSVMVRENSASVTNTVARNMEESITELKQLVESIQSENGIDMAEVKEMIRDLIQKEMGTEIKSMITEQSKEIQDKILEDLSDLQETIRN